MRRRESSSRGLGSMLFGSQAPVGPIWICVGFTSYAIVYTLASRTVHNPRALAVLREQVPISIYDRSTFLFLTALAMDILAILFERQTTKLDYVLLPAFIKGMASTTNLIARFGTPVVAFNVYGRVIMLQRYVCWMHTTATILMLMRMISSTITDSETFTAILFDEIMLITGAAAPLVTGWNQLWLTIITHAAMLPVMPYIYKGFKEAIDKLQSTATKRLMWTIFCLNVVLWTTFAVAWDLAILDLVSPQVEETIYLICDFTAKVLFSSTLMLSSFKGIEARRETAMRHIEESSKQKLIEELRHLLEQKERFMSSVSHELRTPLNGIIGISEGMLSGCCGVLPEQVRRQIYIIRTSGARLLALINDVMDAAALRQNKLVLKQEPVVLRHVVDDVMDLTRGLVDPEVELRNTVPPRITVLGDTGRLVQILNNLLGNAAKFTSRGYIKISARTFDGGSRVAVMVQDTGIGIPKSKLATIFLPFEQVDMSISRKYGGFGLGLNIVQELVKAHGGEIWVESTEGKGSQFTFTMLSARSKNSIDGDPNADIRSSESSNTPTTATGDPEYTHITRGMRLEPIYPARSSNGGMSGAPRRALSRMDERDDLPDMQPSYDDVHYNAAELSALASSRPYAEAAAKEKGVPVTYDPGSEETLTLKPRFHQQNDSYQIMSVDDDNVNQNVIRTLLSSTGYEVITFQSGLDALAHLTSCGLLPDLILLDCMMPEMDGYEVLSRLRATFPRTHIPVIMVSARTEEESIIRGLDCGADDYITKPFRRAELLARIRGQLGEEGQASGEENEEGDTIASSENLHVVPAIIRRRASAARANCIILSIDDDEINQMILQGMLRSQNMRYLKAKTGAEGLAILAAEPQRPPDLILLDASLPDMSGFEVCKRVRALYNKAEVPIIMLSARQNEQAIVEGLLCGANDYVCKPFRRGELLARIRMHLRNSELAVSSKSNLVAGGEQGAGAVGAGRMTPPLVSASMIAAMAGQGEAEVPGYPEPEDQAVDAASLSPVRRSALAAAAAPAGAGGGGAPASKGLSHTRSQAPQQQRSLPGDTTHQPGSQAGGFTTSTSGSAWSHTAGPAPAQQGGAAAAGGGFMAGAGMGAGRSAMLQGAGMLRPGGNSGGGQGHAIPQASNDSLPSATTLALAASGGASGGVGRSTWVQAGVLVGQLSDYSLLVRLLPPEEVTLVMQKLVAMFTGMCENLRLTKVECNGESFVAACVSHAPSADLPASAAVSLLQLAQGLVDGVASLSVRGLARPLQMHVVLQAGPLSGAAGWLYGEAILSARELVRHSPPLTICASQALVARLVAAGLHEPREVAPTPTGDSLLVVEAHPSRVLLQTTGLTAGAGAVTMQGPGSGWNSSRATSVVNDVSTAGTEASHASGKGAHPGPDLQLAALKGELSAMRQMVEQLQMDRALQQQQGHSPALRLGSTSMSAQSGTHASGEGGAHHQHQQQHLTTRSTSVTASQAGAGGVEPRQDSTSVPGSRKGAFSKLMGSLRKGRSKDE